MSLETGARLGRYEIRGLLGRGGMGEVYLALDSELDRQVAVKVLPAEVAGDADRMRRFEREAKAASALNHPGILTIYEIGRAGSTSFIAAERVEGVTLRERMQRGALAPAEAIEVASQVAAALAVAHAAGIVHRDVKPENVMVRRDGLVKLLDFGLARIDPVQAPGDAVTETHTALATRAGAVLGTARYMSPEQACGLPVDARTDVWGLGVVLYEMLTGRAPIEGATTGEILSALVAGSEPPPLSRFLPDAPADLQRIVSRALAPNRNERYHSMQDMALDLKEHSEHRKIEERLSRSGAPRRDSTAGAPATGAGSPSSGRARRILRWGALLAALAIAAVAYLRIAGAGAGAIDSLAVLPFQATGADAETDLLADGLSEGLNNSLSRLSDLRLIARDSVFRYKGKELDLRTIAAALGVRALVTGRLTRVGDDLRIGVELTDARENRHLWGEQFETRPAEFLATQQRIASALADELRSRLPQHERERVARGGTRNPEAYRLYLLGLNAWYKYPRPEFRKSESYFREAIELDPTYAAAYAGLANYYGFGASNGFLPPTDAWPKSKAALESAMRLDPDLAEAHQVLGARKIFVDHDWAGAERSFQRAIELNPSYAETYPLYGALLLAQGRIEESLVTKRKAQEVNPLSPVFHRRFGRHLHALRRFDEAIAEFREAIDLDTADPLAHEFLGETYELAHRQGEAIQAWSAGLRLSSNDDLAELLERTFAESGFETAVKALARAKLDRALSRIEQGEYVAPQTIANLYLRLGDRDAAFDWLAKAERQQSQSRFLLSIGVDPIYDSIRDDPRFVEMMGRIGLPPNPLGVGLVRGPAE